MASIFKFPGKQAVAESRPVLHLSGPKLAEQFERLVRFCEDQGGVERMVEALKLKSAMFQDALGGGQAAKINLEGFEQLCAFMATCRRRMAEPLQKLGFSHFHAGIVELLQGAEDTSTADTRIKAFIAKFPTDKSHRWTRDLAAELLHFTLPEQYPLMTKWVWDSKANTGVLREIWFGDNVDHMVIDIPDTYETFLMLREELSQFLANNGVFRDMLFYVDLLQAQVYADYINAQAGSYLRTDFASEMDPLEHVRRILGLDGVNARTGRTRFKTIDGQARVLDDGKRIT